MAFGTLTHQNEKLARRLHAFGTLARKNEKLTSGNVDHTTMHGTYGTRFSKFSYAF